MLDSTAHVETQFSNFQKYVGLKHVTRRRKDIRLALITEDLLDKSRDNLRTMIRRNIVSNVIARAWGVIAAYLFVPLYLRFLGIEAYGLVGFYSTLAGVLAFADMGFSATLNREFARHSVREDSATLMRDLLRTYEAAYLLISSVAAAAVWTLAPLIAQHWLRSTALRPAEMSWAIRLMGVAIALQMPTDLYVGGLMGLQRQVLANNLQVAWIAFRGVGSVLVMWLYSPTIFAFGMWQLISNVLYLILSRLTLWRVLSLNANLPRSQFRIRVLQETWRYAAGMASMSVVSAVLVQTDKLTVSRMLPLEALGYYTLAGAVASIPLMLASPVSSAVFPRLTGLVALADSVGLANLYHRACEVVAVAIFPTALTLAFFSGEFIFAWTGSTAARERAALAASLLVAGQLMQAITIVPYYLALAHGNVRLNLRIGIISVVLITPLLISLIAAYGIVGAGMSWLVLNVCTLPPYMYFLHQRFLPGQLRRWLLGAVVRPMLGALPCVVLGRLLLPHFESRLMTASYLALVWAFASGATAALAPSLRNFAVEQGRAAWGALSIAR